jgi:SAM-dependent methyltransferase
MTYYAPRYLFRRQTILRILQPGQSFLEIGPGNLQLAQELLTYFHDGTLIDYNAKTETVFQTLPEPTKQRLNLIIANFMTYSLPQKFNCVVACEVMEHVADDHAFLQQLYDSLASQGQLILSVPSRMKMWSEHDDLVGHLRRYEKKDLTVLADNTRFTRIRIDSYGFPFVNFLRLFRVRSAQRQIKGKAHLSQEELTKYSGIEQTENMSQNLGLLINPYTIYPATLFSSLFNRFDLSGGYVLSAYKE